MEKAWQQLVSKQKLTPSKAHGTIAVRWDLHDFFPYIYTQFGVLNEMIFPEPIYVLILRGDGFPCGSRLWVQTTITFANHMARARTPGYTWTLDLALCREIDADVLGVLLHIEQDPENHGYGLYSIAHVLRLGA